MLVMTERYVCGIGSASEGGADDADGETEQDDETPTRSHLAATLRAAGVQREAEEQLSFLGSGPGRSRDPRMKGCPLAI